MQARVKKALLVYLKGLAMGAADSVPGVSGGTIAFISNIYDELLGSIRAINLSSLRLLLRQGPAAAWLAINGNFLLALGIGILTALLIAARMVTWLLDQHYTYLMFFFNGLIVASFWYVSRQVGNWRAFTLALCIAGIGASVGIGLLPSLAGQESLWYIFFCGAVAICAMILPGVSGSFILLLLGAYERMLEALNSLDWPVIGVFIAGCVCGLFGFSRLLYWLLHSHRAPTLACLLGILGGSLYTLWPWRTQGVTEQGVHLVRNNAPSSQDIITGAAISPVLAAALFVTGLALVLGLEQLGNKSGGKSKF